MRFKDIKSMRDLPPLTEDLSRLPQDPTPEQLRERLAVIDAERAKSRVARGGRHHKKTVEQEPGHAEKP